MKRILLAFICTEFQLCMRRCKNVHFMAILLVKKQIFFHKKLKTNVHRKKYRHWWIQSTVDIFLSNLYPRLSSTCMLGFCKLWGLIIINCCPKKTMTTFVGCVSFNKEQYSISKGQLLLIVHTVQVEKFLNHCS